MWSTSCSDVLVAISSKFYALLSNQGSTNIKQNRSMHHIHREYAHKIKRNKHIKSNDHVRNTTRWPRISNLQSEVCSTMRALAKFPFTCTCNAFNERSLCWTRPWYMKPSISLHYLRAVFIINIKYEFDSFRINFNILCRLHKTGLASKNTLMQFILF